jgi:hypothetical protein
MCRSEIPADSEAAVISVNFDPALVKLLREVHDFLLLPSLPAEIPEPAIKASASTAVNHCSCKMYHAICRNTCGALLAGFCASRVKLLPK